jgi:hypothetical protein
MKPFRASLADALAHWPGNFSLAVRAGATREGAPVEEFRVDGHGHATFLSTRGPSGSPTPIGRFEGALPEAEVRAVAKALATIDLDRLESLTPAGGDAIFLEVTASDAAVVVGLDALLAVPEVEQAVSNLHESGVRTLLAKPHAALAVHLAPEKGRWRVTLKKLGPAPFLVGNPLADGGPEPRARLQLHVATGLDVARDAIWATFDVPLAGTVFEGKGRRFFLDSEVGVLFDDPSGGKAATALAVRATYADYDFSAGLRLGGNDVFFGQVESNSVVPPSAP